ncbi:MAG: Na+/H+ antiporter subunit D [Chloroflexota bacterium]|nr:Na+/H+ antiporter subunit D [Dehalococcoidia bacterium]MDW8252631.1 Na+/H+ antiporter subunit D [Chloroflexota bacterium]
MNQLVVLPLLVSLLTAVLCLLSSRSRVAQRRIAMAGGAVLLAVSLGLLLAVWTEGILVVAIGSWPAPFGIVLVADLLSAIMVAITGITGATVLVYSLLTIDRRRQTFGYYPVYFVLLGGICGAFLTGDLFNLFVWFEVMLIASYVLLALGGERAQLEGSIKYVTLNLIASFLFLTAVGVLYGTVGTLNMADLAIQLNTIAPPALVTSLAMLFLVAFGIKAAIFPLFFWLPASYHTPPVAVSAIFAGMLTKVGVYALIRVFTLLFTADTAVTHTLILVIAALTMITGVLGAVAQYELRRVLSFHIISQIGYMIMGLGLFTPLGLAGSIFYIIHHIIVKTNLFLIGGIAARVVGAEDLRRMGSLVTWFPLLAGLFLIPALSLGGVPPFSGFFAKLALVQAGLAAGQYVVVGISLATGLLTLYSMIKIWNEAFWKPAPPGADGEPPREPTKRIIALRPLLGPVVTLAALTVLIGVLAGPVFALAEEAADQLLARERYIEAVLGR